MPIAPTTVPIIRNEALRSEATQRDRQTEAQSLSAKRNAGVAARNPSTSDALPDLMIDGSAAVIPNPIAASTPPSI